MQNEIANVLFTNAWDSPFIVPVAGCFMIAVIVIASTAAASRKREIESQERLAEMCIRDRPCIVCSAWGRS